MSCCGQEATLALNEALHVAQQSSDHVALANSLAALTALLDAAAPGLAPSVQEMRGLDGPHTKHLQLLRLLRRCEPAPCMQSLYLTCLMCHT